MFRRERESKPHLSTSAYTNSNLPNYIKAQNHQSTASNASPPYLEPVINSMNPVKNDSKIEPILNNMSPNIENNSSGYLEPVLEKETTGAYLKPNEKSEEKYDNQINSSYLEPIKPEDKASFVIVDEDDKSDGYLSPRYGSSMSNASASSTAPLIKPSDVKKSQMAKMKYAPPPPIFNSSNKLSAFKSEEDESQV